MFPPNAKFYLDEAALRHAQLPMALIPQLAPQAMMAVPPVPQMVPPQVVPQGHAALHFAHHRPHLPLQQQARAQTLPTPPIVQQEQPKKRYPCKICGNRYSHSSGVWQHMKEKHKDYKKILQQRAQEQKQLQQHHNQSQSQQQQRQKQNQNQNQSSGNQSTPADAPRPYTCMICQKKYANNSGIWNHMREKHGEYDAEKVRYESPYKLNKRGRPKITRATPRQALEERCAELELEKLIKFDIDLDLLQSEHVRMALSAIIEFGEPTRTRRQNLFIADCDEENQSAKDTDLASVWPEVTGGEERLTRFRNFVGKCLQDVREDAARTLAAVMHPLLEFVRAHDNAPTQDEEKHLCDEMRAAAEGDREKYALLWEAHESVQQQQQQGDESGATAEIQRSPYTVLTLPSFLTLLAHCVLGYTYNRENEYTTQYFGN